MPGAACLTNSKIADDITDAELVETDTTELEHPEITATAELQERDELAERDAKKHPYSYGGWWGKSRSSLLYVGQSSLSDRIRLLRRSWPGLCR